MLKNKKLNYLSTHNLSTALADNIANKFSQLETFILIFKV